MILALCFLNFASLKIYKNKSQTQFYALSILICTISQPELWSFCGAAKTKVERRADKLPK
jgi:hypothetical protein